jgi:hypothetical protein
VTITETDLRMFAWAEANKFAVANDTPKLAKDRAQAVFDFVSANASKNQGLFAKGDTVKVRVKQGDGDLTFEGVILGGIK